jgi:hypothetical protein
MRISNRHNEKGIALILSILALLLLSAIAVGMMYMSTTEASINANFKAEEAQYFAARAGVEEVRDRMLPSSPNTINAYAPNAGGVDTCTGICLLPTSQAGNPPPVPAIGAGPPVLYILQNGVTMANVTTGTPATNPLYDDEFCHDFPGYNGMNGANPNVRCTSLPGGNWYSTPPAPPAGSPFLSAVPNPIVLDWKWVRVTLKGNTSSAAYPVSVGGAWDLVCWNGTSEVTAPAGTAVFPQNNSPCGSLNPYANPVYLVTSLSVSPSGARRLVQQELAQTPANQPAGLFATATGCAALKLSGGAQTFSFNSGLEVGGPTNPPSNWTASGGDVGANGNVDVAGAGTTVNGSTYTNETTSQGPCNQNNGVSGNGNAGTIANIPTYPTAYAPPVPPVPNPMPPTGNFSANGLTLPPGAYADVKITGGTTTLPGGVDAAHPAVYTFNSLSISGGGQLAVNGPVIINIAYQGNGSAITMTSANSFVNNSAIASYLTINYCCSGSVNLAGGTAAYAVVNAPNANISFTGGSNFYGQAVGLTIDDSGSATSFYWDKSANISPVTSPYYEISLRELSY